MWVNTNAEGITAATRMDKLATGASELLQNAQEIRSLVITLKILIVTVLKKTNL